MRTKFFSYLMVLSIILFTGFAQAQTRSFENIIKMRLRNSGVLLEDENVRGYYFFYRLDKSGKGKRHYLLRLLDQNLKDIKTTQIEESKYVSLVDAKYNGDEIMLKMLDYRNRSIIYMNFDKNAELISRQEIANVNRYEMLSYGTLQDGRETDNLKAIHGRGFVDYSLTKNGKGYQIMMLPKGGDKSKSWTISTDPKSKQYQLAGMLEATENTLVNIVVKKKNRTTKSTSYFLQGIDLNTGKITFEKDLKGKYIHQPLTSYIDNKNGMINVMGVYYLDDSKTDKDNGLGLFRLTLDDEGNIYDHKYLAYSGDFSKHVPVGRKGQIGEGRSYTYFHNIIQNSDGSILAIGEQYKRSADALGIAASVLGGGNSAVTKMVIEDLVVTHFSPDFEINSIGFVEKTKSDFTLPSGYDFYNTHYLSLIVKAYGGFDYMFTQKIDQDDATAICYLDYEKQTKGGKKWIFGAITLKDGKYVSDKMILGKPRDMDKIAIRRAKPGYIVVTEYIRKEKKLEVHLERINY